MTTASPLTRANLIEHLRSLGADRIRHSRRTLLDHLVGTADVLSRWGAEPHICRAGLFHSVYGTAHFTEVLVHEGQRPSVRAAIGEDAERLVAIFCRLDRSSLLEAASRGAPFALRSSGGDTFGVSGADLTALVWMVWANVVDQAPHLRDTWNLARERAAFSRVRHLLPLDAQREVSALIGEPSTVPHGVQPGLRALFALEDSSSFVGEYFPDRMFLARGPVERLAGLVDYELDDLLAMKVHHIKAFIRQRNDRPAELRIDASQVKTLYAAGHTIYFHSLRSPRMDVWVDALDAELGLLRGATRVSGFASLRGIGLKPHFDMNDNFVCQAKGTKRWRIAANTHVKHPSVGYTVGEPLTAIQRAEAPRGFPTELPTPFETVELVPGSVLFVPRGVWHDTETVDTASLHFNVQSGVPTWKDLIEYLLAGTTALHHLEELRAPVLALFADGKLREGVEEELKAHLRRLVDVIVQGDITIDQATFHRHVAKRRMAN